MKQFTLLSPYANPTPAASAINGVYSSTVAQPLAAPPGRQVNGLGEAHRSFVTLGR